jgi:arylsulfatase A-like enzyme
MSGDIVFSAAADSLVTRGYHTGTNHGSMSPDDSTVPVIVYAPGWAPKQVDAPVSLLQVAPTVAALLGIAPPPAARAPALTP